MALDAKLIPATTFRYAPFPIYANTIGVLISLMRCLSSVFSQEMCGAGQVDFPNIPKSDLGLVTVRIRMAPF